MSTAASVTDTMLLCASCGVAGGDDIKLKNCTACYLVKYCSVKCQKDHRPRHKKECKKRAAELRDELLFKQPESSCYGDCPICCVPLPIDLEKSAFYACCSKLVCDGCMFANKKRENKERLQEKCPFCRTAAPDADEDVKERLMKRIEANDPVAMREMGLWRVNEGDYNAAFEYLTKAASLEDVQAHFLLSLMYLNGHGVEKDKKKKLHHAEIAAIGGHPTARHNLGCVEERENRRMDRAVKHWIIAAKLGFDTSLNALKSLHKNGHVSKEDLATALCGYQSAFEATKSPQRDEAAEYYKQFGFGKIRGV